jgi:heme-degrading monooxygenase HmoA
MKSIIILFASIVGLTTSAQSRPVLIDKFYVPKAAISAFTERMDVNRKLIRTLPGFVKDDVYQQPQENGDIVIVTVAVWENQQNINKAKETVQSEYKRTGFDMPEFISKLGIKLERGIFTETE